MANGKLAQKAEECTKAGTEEHRELSSEFCWDAVVKCAFWADAIGKKEYLLLYNSILKDKYSNFVSPNAPIVRNKADMLSVPKGSFLAFISDEEIGTKQHLGGMVGHLIHAMVAIGGGWAAGTNNGCIGGCAAANWEKLDLANKLNWAPKGTGFTARRAKGETLIQIRFREL